MAKQNLRRGGSEILHMSNEYLHKRIIGKHNASLLK